MVGHEIGHSVLKHNLRQNSDLISTLAEFATLVGRLKSGAGGATAMTLGKSLHNGYTRDDEREADAFGVLVAWRAGLDAMGGAAFLLIKPAPHLPTARTRTTRHSLKNARRRSPVAITPPTRSAWQPSRRRLIGFTARGRHAHSRTPPYLHGHRLTRFSPSDAGRPERPSASRHEGLYAVPTSGGHLLLFGFSGVGIR